MTSRVPADLNVQQLRVFIVLGEELHFGRTAERLSFSQPYVSRSLAALERRIGGRLLDRNTRNVRLTPLGKSFHAEATAVYEDLVRAFDRARSSAAGLHGVLVVGCTTTSAGAALTELVARFETAHPEYRVRLRELPLNHPYDALRSGAVDVLVHWLPEQAPDLEWGPAIEEQEIMLAMRSGHPLSACETVSIEDVADYGLPAMAEVDGPASVAQALWPTETQRGRVVPRHGPACHTMTEVVDSLVRSDLVKPTVISIAHVNAHRRDLAFRSIDDVPPLRLGPIWLTGRKSAAIRTFVAAARRQVGRRTQARHSEAVRS